MRNHQLQVPHEVVAKQVVEREVLTKGLVAKGLMLTQRLVAKEVVVALAKELGGNKWRRWRCLREYG